MRKTRLRFWQSALEKTYDALYPPRCSFCGIGMGFICDPCRRDLQWNHNACERCAVPLESGEVCADCLRAPPLWSCAKVPLRYAFPLDFAIKRFKFHAAVHYIPMFAELLGSTLLDLPTGIDAIQPMPLHWRRHAWRGFNQATELARPLARHLQLPMGDFVRRRGHTSPQSSLTPERRRRDLGAHFVAQRAVSSLHVLIVDDVMTTGASVAGLSRCLLNAGASEVSVLALARS